MNRLRIIDGELELLALGQLDANESERVLKVIASDTKLKIEYDQIQCTLGALAKAEARNPPAVVFEKTRQTIFGENARPQARTKVNWKTLRIAAAILLAFCSAAIFISSNKKQVVQNLSANLAMKPETFNDLLDFVAHQMKTRDCEGNFDISVEFMDTHKLRKHEPLELFAKHEVYCDCELIYNVSSDGELKDRSEWYLHPSPDTGEAEIADGMQFYNSETFIPIPSLAYVGKKSK